MSEGYPIIPFGMHTRKGFSRYSDAGIDKEHVYCVFLDCEHASEMLFYKELPATKLKLRRIVPRETYADGWGPSSTSTYESKEHPH